MRHVGTASVVLLVAAALAAGLGSPVEAVEGPDPARTFRTVTVPSLDSVLAVEERSVYDGPTTIWRFDLRANRWERFALAPSEAGMLGLLAVVPTDTAVYSISLDDRVGRLDLVSREWTWQPAPRHRPVEVTDIAVDERRGTVLAWSDWYDELWTYEPHRNRWTRVPQTGPWPRVGLPGGGGGYSLMAFDGRADRAVLAVIPVAGRRGATWLFDPENSRWARTRSSPPELNYGYGEWASNAVYDPAHDRTVLFARAVVAAYDLERDSWEVPSSARWPGLAPGPYGLVTGALARSDSQLAVDPVHGRLVLIGGSALFNLRGVEPPMDFAWQPVRDVWAYDVGFNTWTRLTGS